jgi:hypothetical protein
MSSSPSATNVRKLRVEVLPLPVNASMPVRIAIKMSQYPTPTVAFATMMIRLLGIMGMGLSSLKTRCGESQMSTPDCVPNSVEQH